MSIHGLKSIQVGFHVLDTGETGPNCGGRVTWHDSPSLSWLECECGASSLMGHSVTYGTPVLVPGLPPSSAEEQVA